MLTKRALDCYWLMVFNEYSRLFRFKPAAADRQYFLPLMPLEEWLGLERENEEDAVWVPEGHLELRDPDSLAATQGKV